MILTLITVGKMLEALSKGRTTDALKGLMKLAPKTATLLRDCLLYTSRCVKETGRKEKARAGEGECLATLKRSPLTSVKNRVK